MNKTELTEKFLDYIIANITNIKDIHITNPKSIRFTLFNKLYYIKYNNNLSSFELYNSDMLTWVFNNIKIKIIIGALQHIQIEKQTIVSTDITTIIEKAITIATT